MKKDIPSREQLLAENARLRVGYWIEEASATTRFLIGALCVAFVTWCAKEVFGTLAGRSTDAHIVIDFFSRIEVAAVISIATGAGGVLYGFSQRQLRRATVKRLQGRIYALERGADPGRTSSELAPDGSTNPEDI